MSVVNSTATVVSPMLPERGPSLLELQEVDVEGEHLVPEFFSDVGLDQVVDQILAGWGDYGLGPVYYRTLSSPEAVAFRQDVFRDLEERSMLERLRAFLDRMRAVRHDLDQARALRLDLQRQACLLSAARTYCAAVQTLAQDLAEAGARSAGLRRVLRYLDDYRTSQRFGRLERESRDVERALGEIVYCVEVGHHSVRVTRFEGQADEAEQIAQTFGRFGGAARTGPTAPHDAAADLNEVEAAVLEMVAKLFPTHFAALDAFWAQHRGFADRGVSTIERQAAFYIAYLDYLRPLKRAGLPVCYPEVSTSKEIRVAGAYDLALAARTVSRGGRIVGNDISLHGDERVIVVTGPNQGGKTTFARMFAQLHHLAALGCPVPGTAARLFLPDQILTHFDRQEALADLRGKLEDDLVRIRDLLLRATPASIVVANELFACTSPADALALGRRIVEELAARNLLAVYVTFVDELASLGPQVVSMTATVEPGDPRVRTFRIVRGPADGRAYAVAIARRYALDRAALKERLAR
jgi:DNA mismatch repair ATPase MutS